MASSFEQQIVVPGNAGHHFHRSGTSDRFAVRGDPGSRVSHSVGANMAEVFGQALLAGKNAIVTGGGSGINLAIARRFAESGAKVALIGRTKEKLDSAAGEIRNAGGVASGHPADVRDYDALSAAIKSARETHCDIVLVVCGAARNFLAPPLR